MKQITVRVADLLARVKENRAKHNELFLKAQEGFRRAAIEELDAMLELARKGEVRQFVGLTAPEDHTAEYDRAIDMLEMTTDNLITVDAITFAQLARNEWAWFASATATNTLYAKGGKLGGSR